MPLCLVLFVPPPVVCARALADAAATARLCRFQVNAPKAMRCDRLNMAIGTIEEVSLPAGEPIVPFKVEPLVLPVMRRIPCSREVRAIDLSALKTAAAAASTSVPKSHRHSKYIINPTQQQISFLKRVREGGHVGRAFGGGFVEEE